MKKILQAAKNRIKPIIFNQKNASLAYIERLYSKSCIKTEKEIYTGWDSKFLLSESDLLSQACDIARKKSSENCHIIAGGYSTIDSIKRIEKNDFIIGFNFSAVADLHFDLYFIEIASEREPYQEISRLQSELVNSIANNRISMIIAKNLWEGKIDKEMLLREYSSDIKIIYDTHVPRLPYEQYPALAKGLAKALIRPRPQWVVQYGGTVITCIQIASKLGFKRIVVHGLDFGGPYFYKDICTNLPEKFESSLFKIYHCTPSDSPHGNGSWISNILPHIRDELLENGMQLLCATEKSASSKILEVHNSQTKYL
jgi:hypothetical protein